MTSGSTYSTISTILYTVGHKEKELRSHPLLPAIIIPWVNSGVVPHVFSRKIK
jgi:hypothetical protein